MHLNIFLLYKYICEIILQKNIARKYNNKIIMSFLLKLCALWIVVVVVECTTGGGCLSSDSGSMDKCGQDWKQMSTFVAGLVDVGRSTAAVVDEDEEDKVETKSNALTLLVRVASGVIGRGTDAMKSLIVSGLMLLTRTASARRRKTCNVD